MSAAYRGNGGVKSIIAATDLQPGQIVPIGNRVGVVQGLDAIPVGERAELALEGVFDVPVTSGSYAFGDEMSYSTTGSAFSETGTSGSVAHGIYWGASATAGCGQVYLKLL